MQKRGDFEHEYDNDAELILAEMEFNEEDSAEIIKMKEEIINIYNARLDQRIKRKQFVIEHDLLDFQK
jgi:transcriptional adapter 2-alpha